MSIVYIPPGGATGITNPGVVTASITIPNGGYTTTASNITMSGNTYPSVNITQDGITLPADADITIGNMSLKDLMQSLSDRLAILQPDPEKLQQFEALKQAYEHYKTLEALCLQPTDTV